MRCTATGQQQPASSNRPAVDHCKMWAAGDAERWNRAAGKSGQLGNGGVARRAHAPASRATPIPWPGSPAALSRRSCSSSSMQTHAEPCSAPAQRKEKMVGDGRRTWGEDFMRCHTPHGGGGGGVCVCWGGGAGAAHKNIEGPRQHLPVWLMAAQPCLWAVGVYPSHLDCVVVGKRLLVVQARDVHQDHRAQRRARHLQGGKGGGRGGGQ